jgi:hypothetical protein
MGICKPAGMRVRGAQRMKPGHDFRTSRTKVNVIGRKRRPVTAPSPTCPYN